MNLKQIATATSMFETELFVERVLIANHFSFCLTYMARPEYEAGLRCAALAGLWRGAFETQLN